MALGFEKMEPGSLTSKVWSSFSNSTLTYQFSIVAVALAVDHCNGNCHRFIQFLLTSVTLEDLEWH